MSIQLDSGQHTLYSGSSWAVLIRSRQLLSHGPPCWCSETDMADFGTLNEEAS